MLAQELVEHPGKCIEMAVVRSLDERPKIRTTAVPMLLEYNYGCWVDLWYKDELHWLFVKARIEYKNLLFTIKT